MPAVYSEAELRLVRDYIGKCRRDGDSVALIKARLRKAKVEPGLVSAALRSQPVSGPVSMWVFWVVVGVLAFFFAVLAFLLASGW